MYKGLSLLPLNHFTLSTVTTTCGHTVKTLSTTLHRFFLSERRTNGTACNSAQQYGKRCLYFRLRKYQLFQEWIVMNMRYTDALLCGPMSISLQSSCGNISCLTFLHYMLCTYVMLLIYFWHTNSRYTWTHSTPH